MVRVVMFTNTYAPMVGGLERSVANSHADLNRAGHLCRVITPGFAGASSSSGGILRLPAVQKLGTKGFSLPLPLPGQIPRWVEAIEPDVVHAHQPFLLGQAAHRTATRRQVPFVFTHHTLYERYSYYVPMDPERARQWIIAATTRFANRCNLVIAPTASVRSLLLERGVTAPIEVAPSGIDRDLYARGCRPVARRRFALQPGDEVVGHLGRLSREKNLTYLIDAMLKLMSSRASVKWLLVGDGDRLAEARARLAEAGLLDRLITPGVLEGASAAEAYAAMDLFTFASHTDTQALVLAESMAAGVPIVALDAPGVRDCVVDQVNGVLLPAAADPQEFAQVLTSLLDDPERRRFLAEGARRQSHLYSRSKCLGRLVEAYGRAIEEFAECTDAPAWERASSAE